MTTSEAAAPPHTMLYLVGFARAGELIEFHTPGIDAEHACPARSITIQAGPAALDAIVVEVPTPMFVGTDAEARLHDVAWLRPRAERHEAILAAARERTSVMPVGFGSVFSGVDALAASLAGRGEHIASFLDDTDGCDEWSLKVWASRSRAVERARQTFERQQRAGAPDGAAYLRAKRLAAEAEALAEDQALQRVEELIEQLGETAADAVERRATRFDEDPDAWLITHVALLVRRDDQAEFDRRLDAAAEQLDQQGIRLEVTGPWAPYSFCPELSVAPDGEPG